ncbi:MAG TPA: TadE/TadG family type IV pilus assembly protein [Anaeromyxobacteraceae bacterium]|nr:TadE/TadG family type IV pilus assembly protein [Anaeromyxobacteraceae bacterium]
MRSIRRSRPRGAVLIEFVLVLPFFLLVLLGAIDWGWYFTLRETAINATREGARTGSVQETQAAATTAAAAAVTGYLTRSGLPLHPPTVEITTLTVGGTPVTAVSVSLVAYPAGSITGFTATRVPTTLTARTVMRLEVQP